MSSFRRRQMMAAAGGGAKDYIVFADPVVAQICATNWGDGVGITPAQAAAVTNNQFGTTFQGNTQITSFDELRYFTGLGQIPNNAFRSCSNLVSVSLPDNITMTGAMCFAYCSALTEFTIGSTTNYVLGGGDMFYGTSNVTRVNVPTLEDWIRWCAAGYQTSNGVENTNPILSGGALYIGGNEAVSVTLPAGITALYARMFRGLTNLRSVTIPNTVTSINVSCFENCPNLELDVSGLFQNVQTIYSSVFSGCPKITGVLSLPSLVTTSNASYVIRSTGINRIENLGNLQIVNGALFFGAMLESAQLPQTVTEIGYDSFYSTQQMEELEILATIPPTLNQWAFGTFPKKVFVPYSADHSILTSYQSATNWSDYASRIYELNPDGTIPT